MNSVGERISALEGENKSRRIEIEDVCNDLERSMEHMKKFK
jgi:hypothetical protein